MPRPASLRAALAVAACLVAATGCSRTESQSIEVGRHDVRLVTPRGWEHLDHGRQQLFRSGESELLLEDLGPVTRKGLANELVEAERMWRSGRRRDALARVRVLHGPPISLLPQEARAAYWAPWTNVTYKPDPVDSAALGRAFQELIRGTESLPEVSPGTLVGCALAAHGERGRAEIAHESAMMIHGARWIWVETWDPVSHLNRQRLACVEDDGYLLALSTRRGLLEQTGPAFDALLASIEVVRRR